MTRPVAFHDLPAHKFPMVFRGYPEESTEDTNVLWEVRVPAPGIADIPGILETGQRVRIVATFADGTEERS